MENNDVDSQVPLVLGGHSFIPELGNDPAADNDTQILIVAACLDRGIRCFDTTYQPERVALGRILEQLGRRDEAQIIAWNFFEDPGTGASLVPPKLFEQHHLDVLLEQLRTEHIDYLVVHPVGCASDNQRQLEIARSWMQSGAVGALGTWMPSEDPEERYGSGNPFHFMVAPRNVSTPNSAIFTAAKALHWKTFATSPFNRGWLLDRLLEGAIQLEGGDRESLRERLADRMLRYTLFAPNIDRVIIGIRRLQWIDRNLESVRRGPLSEKEKHWLARVANDLKSAG